ncbi:Protein phosphatase 2C [Cynara cardunculus var. scolymus]|uniref:protein-serine/threonine phosphatase n=1 Tax=Cynara cardunculus var. scolymus TaxID=59895 RepID=A0A118K3B9_CYNCS|nr:Protein phosphatase 2C [Cynara cardunculus var. scolymus]
MPPSILRLSDGDTTVTLQTPFTVLTTSKKRKRPPMIEIPNVLQEIESAAVKFTPKNFESRSDAVFSSSGFGVGVCSVKGRKSFMEDTHTIVSSSNTDKVFFGVYDGHGGSKAAEFVAKNLHSNVLEMLDKCSDNTTTEEVVKAAFIKTDDEFLKQGLGSGTCCVTALIKGKELVVSNLGDCRAVLSRKGKADMLTNDHRASHEDERDAHLKDWVVGEPETKVLPLTEDLEYLVLASDGLWDEVGNQEAIDVVTRCMLSPKAKKVYRMKRTVKNNRKESENNEPTRPMVKTRTLNQNSNCKLESQTKLIEACRELVNLGVSRGSLDDITVMIVDLKAFQ